MYEFTEVHAIEFTYLLFEDEGISKETINKALETLGKTLIDHDNKGHSKENLSMMHFINITISNLHWLIGAVSSKRFIKFVNFNNIKSLLEASLKTVDFLVENYELLCKEFKEKNSPEDLDRMKVLINIQLEGARQESTYFYPEPFIKIRNFNLQAYKGLTGPEAVKKYITWMNLVSRVIMFYISEFDEECKIKTYPVH